MGLVSASLDFKRLGVIISENLYGELEDYYGHAFNLDNVELGKKFAWVEVLPIQGKELIFIDNDGYVMELDEESPTG